KWPFLEPRHRELAQTLDRWASENIAQQHPAQRDEVDAACRSLVRQLGGSGYGAVNDAIDTRALCLIRETLARHSGLADFAFAMQGLGTGAITLFGTEEQKRAYLPRAASGEAIAA